MTIVEQVAHLKGLAEGLDIRDEKSKEARLLVEMIGVLDSIAQKVSELEEDAEDLYEGLDEVADELSDFEEDYYGGDDGTWSIDEDDEIDEFDDCEDDEDDSVYYLVTCPKCGEELTLDEDTLLQGNIRCESCNQLFSLEIVDDDEDSESDYADEE